MKLYTYNQEKYKFTELLRDLYSVNNLEAVTANWLPPIGLKGLGADTHSDCHEKFYEKLRLGWPEFTGSYTKFIRDEIFPLFGNKRLVYQALPSFRIQFSNSKAVTTWHFDGDFNHKHPEWEINIQLPFTVMKNTSATWVESIPGLRDFYPMNCNPGEFLMFYGNKLLHGNKNNETGKTRMSIDFRVIPFERYNPDWDKTTTTTKQRFKIGEYYSVMGG